MSQSQQITEITVFHLKEGVSLQKVVSSSTSQDVQIFIKLADIVKTQTGFIRQFWGHEFEHPHLFVWAIEWESFEHYTAFLNEDPAGRSTFKAGLSQLFHLKGQAPVTLFTRVADPEGATASFRSGITEVAFYTMPTRPDEALKAEIEKGSETVLQQVQSIGKATGASIGWVFDAIPQSLAFGADSISLYGVFGYANHDVHMRWRDTPEGTKAREPGPPGSLQMTPATIVPGIDADTGYFHVKFQEGV